MISSAEQDDERHPRVVVDDGEPLQVARGDVRVRPEVAQVAGALGEPGVEVHDRVGVAGQHRAQVHDPAVRGHDVGLPVPRVVRLRWGGRRRRERLVHRRAPPAWVPVCSTGSSAISRAGRGDPGRAAGRPPAGCRAPRRRPGPPPSVHGSCVHVDPVRHVGRQRPPGEPRGVADPAGGHRPARVDVAVEHRGEQVGPRPRNHPEQPVPAAAESEPPAPGRALGQLAQLPVDRPVSVDGQPQVGQRVFRVGVRAALGDQQSAAGTT